MGIFILSIALYRNDGLSVFYKLFGPQIEQKKKTIIKIFKDCRLSITVTTNIISVDFLDLTLNLKTESYQPLRKPNNDPIYPIFESSTSNTEVTSKVH